MPYTDPIRRALIKRAHKRAMKHGKDWRQIVEDCAGMCVYPVNGYACGSSDYLEFHEQFGEDHKGDGRMQERILLCPDHHYEIHDGTVALIDSPHTPSMLIEDVSLEMYYCGGLAGWVKKYNIDESRFGCKLPK